MSQKSSVQRYFSKLADVINTKGYGAIDQVDPKMMKAAGSIADALDGAPATVDNLKQFFSGAAGMNAILSGSAARVAGGVAMFPHLSAVGAARVAAKGALNGTIDFLKDRGTDAGKIGQDFAKNGLISTDIAGAPHDLMAADATGHLPANLAEIAPTDGSQTFTKRMGGYAANIVMGGPSKVARVIKQMTTLAPTSTSIDLHDPGSVVMLKRMLQYSLPAYAVDHLTNLYATTKDEGQKFSIVKGAVDQMLHLAGVYSGPNGAEVGQKIMDTMDQSFHGETYAANGLDKIADGTRAAVFDSQLSGHVFIPSFKEVHASAMQGAHLAGLRVPVDDIADKFMGAWRAGVLFRPGFPIRTSIDENLGNALRNGVMPTIAAHFAYRAAKSAGKKDEAAKLVEEGMDPKLGKTARAISVLADKVPAPILDKVQSSKDLASAVFGDAAWKAVSPFSKGLTREDMHAAAGAIQDHVWDAVSPTVSALEHSGGGYDEGEDLLRTMVNGKPKYMHLSVGKTFSDVAASDPFWRQKWQMSLGTMARSQLAQSVLKDIDLTRQTQERNVLKIIQSPEFADTKARMARSFKLPDGRQVGVDATQQEADRAFARTVVSAVHSQVRSGNPKDGPIIRGLVGVLRSGDAPTSDLLDSIPHDQLPASTYGPDLIPVSPIKSWVERGFAHLGGMMDNLARQPIFTHAFAQSYKEIMPWAEKLAGEGTNAEELASHWAADRAMAQVKPFLHSPEVRSQFEILHRTAMPFLFAQTQFAKRWAKTFVTNPDAIAKAQLGMNGLRTTGIIHKDASGQDVFYYPGSQYVTDVIARTANAIGIPAFVPLSIPFTGQVKYLMPGLSNPLTPSVGPTVAIPLKGLTSMFPELNQVEQTLLGPGASNSYWEQVMPTSLARVIHAVSDSPDQNGQFSSAMMKAMQDLQATGNGLAPNANAAQKQAYITRVTDWTRILFFTKAILGFSAPASPQYLFDPKDLSGQLSTLMNELPYDQAITEFIRENPDASPYTVFASSSTGGASLPSTQAAGQFLTQNAGFTQQYPQAAGWLIPKTTGTQPFDAAVYREQIAYGMRDSKLPADFLNNILTAPAAKVYYAAYDKEQADLGNGSIDANGVYTPYVGKKRAIPTAQANAIRSTFDQEKAQFLAQNPTFANQLTDSTTKGRREQTIWQLQQALTDPNLPQGPQTDHVKAMMQAFDSYMTDYDSLLGITTTAATAAKKSIQDGFIAEGTQYAALHPEVSDMWTQLIRPEVTDTTIGLSSTSSAAQLSQAGAA
jgi:hypothetical protein